MANNVEPTCQWWTLSGHRCQHPTSVVIEHPQYGRIGVCGQHSREFPDSMRKLYVPQMEGRSGN